MDPILQVIRHDDGRAYCTTEYVPEEGWLLITWQGFVSPADAEKGAKAALKPLGLSPILYLLNDNSQIKGPWFDSVDWLKQVWAPQAARMGLRYVAHVAQPHTEAELSVLLNHNPFDGKFDLQLFTTLEEATSWLHDCQRQEAEHPTPPRPATGQ